MYFHCKPLRLLLQDADSELTEAIHPTCFSRQITQWKLHNPLNLTGICLLRLDSIYDLDNYVVYASNQHDLLGGQVRLKVSWDTTPEIKGHYTQPLHKASNKAFLNLLCL